MKITIKYYDDALYSLYKSVKNIIDDEAFEQLRDNSDDFMKANHIHIDWENLEIDEITEKYYPSCAGKKIQIVLG
jgi:hypothetical protein